MFPGGDLIRIYRERAGLLPVEVAFAMGVSPAVYREVEKGNPAYAGYRHLALSAIQKLSAEAQGRRHGRPWVQEVSAEGVSGNRSARRRIPHDGERI